MPGTFHKLRHSISVRCILPSSFYSEQTRDQADEVASPRGTAGHWQGCDLNSWVSPSSLLLPLSITWRREEGAAALCRGMLSQFWAPCFRNMGTNCTEYRGRCWADEGSEPQALEMVEGTRVACCRGHITSGGGQESCLHMVALE